MRTCRTAPLRRHTAPPSEPLVPPHTRHSSCTGSPSCGGSIAASLKPSSHAARLASLCSPLPTTCRHGGAFLKELELPAEQEEEGHGELAVHTYAQGHWTLFKANMGRQTKLFMRNKAFIVIRM